MKKIKLAATLALMLVIGHTTMAQDDSTQTQTFKVWGNCGMCKKTIEKALKLKGISSAKWDKNTKMLTVSFQPQHITLQAIHKKIASVGYDTELEKADDEVYSKLHGCCQYERRTK